MEDISINTNNKRVRDEGSEELESDSPEAKRIRENLLDDILDESEFSVDRNSANLDLVSVMKSFEEEIISFPEFPPSSHAEEDLNLVTCDQEVDQQPELGYLLEASDDDLGLPPTLSSSPSEEESDLLLCVPSDTVGLDQIWGFEDEIPSYEFGIGYEKQNNNDGGDFAGLEGLFEYGDVLSGLSDLSDFSWRSENYLPAL